MANSRPPGYLLSGVNAQGVGYSMDCHDVLNEGLLSYRASGESAIFNFEESYNDSAWMVVATYTATATQSGTAQLQGFFPYVRANVTKVYTATAAATATGYLWVHWSPVL